MFVGMQLSQTAQRVGFVFVKGCGVLCSLVCVPLQHDGAWPYETYFKEPHDIDIEDVT